MALKKRWAALVFALLLILSLAACRQTPAKESGYSEADIQAAKDIVTAYFQTHFTGCTLLKLYYDEANARNAEQEWAAQYGADEVIVLSSDYRTGPEYLSGLEPNEDYLGWTWILAREKGGSWELKDKGYPPVSSVVSPTSERTDAPTGMPATEPTTAAIPITQG